MPKPSPLTHIENPVGLAKPTGVWTPLVTSTSGTLVFISGLLAWDEQRKTVGVGDMAAQTEQVVVNLRHALASVDATLEDIARLDVYVTDISRFAEIHSVRKRYFPSNPPASTMVEVSKFIDPDCLIEMNAIAIVNNTSV